MGDARCPAPRQSGGVQTTAHGVHARGTFWWDRARPVDADAHRLRAVIFDADAMARVDDDGDMAPRDGLIDLVMNLFVAGIWVGVVSSRPRACAEPLVRQLVGDGLVETLVTADDVAEPNRTGELYRLALWELGITPQSALAFVSSDRGAVASVAAGLPTVVITSEYADDQASADACQQLHRRWWVQQKRWDDAA